jgi:TatD DNase family protein
LGLHPQLAQERRAELSLFDRLLGEAGYVGEVGLDGSPECRRFWDDQLAVFSHILDSCQRAGGRIMSIHSRRAAGDVLDCLADHPSAGVPILHWFSGSVAELRRATQQGCWFSVGPAMLAGARGRNLVAHMPHARVVGETDGPFAQVGGRAILPWEVGGIVGALADAWKVNADEVQDILARNIEHLWV